MKNNVVSKIRYGLIVLAVIGYIAFFKLLAAYLSVELIIVAAVYTLIFISSLYILNLMTRAVFQEERAKYIFPFILSFGLFGVVGAAISGIELKIYGFIPFVVLFFYSLRLLHKERII